MFGCILKIVNRFMSMFRFIIVAVKKLVDYRLHMLPILYIRQDNFKLHSLLNYLVFFRHPSPLISIFHNPRTWEILE